MSATETIAKAFVAFQAECENVVTNQVAKVKTRDGGSYSYEYADLVSVLAEVKPKLKKHGLALLQMPISGPDAIGVRTLLVHESGEKIDLGEILLPLANATPQGAGACVTYARRYALGAIAGIATEHDDDAASHEGVAPPRAEHPQSPSPPPPAGRPSYAPATPGDEGEWFDKAVGFGKHKTRTWRQMCEGSVGGDRHSYLEWLAGDIQKKLAENPDGKYATNDAARLATIQRCLAIISEREDTANAETDSQQPEIGEDIPF